MRSRKTLKMLFRLASPTGSKNMPLYCVLVSESHYIQLLSAKPEGVNNNEYHFRNEWALSLSGHNNLS
jgi:hypothetical protein